MTDDEARGRCMTDCEAANSSGWEDDMKLTYDLLVKHNACIPQRDEFRRLFPDGCEPTIDNLLYLSSCEYPNGATLDPWWLYYVLPDEGPGSKRAYALWCAEQVAYLCDDQRVRDCLAVVRRRVEDPTQPGTSDADLAAARAAARAAADAADAAAAYAAYAAADATRTRIGRACCAIIRSKIQFDQVIAAYAKQA
jgi:hypothetical protein